jgi:peptidoglycan biosynthesis protein MviN/MurJ (putative lipid II flippase)
MLVSRVFLGFAPGIIGWALLDLTSRCLFAMDRPRLPIIAAFIPLAVNLTTMLTLGKVKDPTYLCVGVSAGLLTAFAMLFLAIHLRRPSDVTQIPESRDEKDREQIDDQVHVSETAP